MTYLVVDNGSYSVKAGFAESNEPTIQHNAISKAKDGSLYIGSDYISTNNHSGLIFKRPHEQGHLTSWETEKPVWDYTFDLLSKKDINPTDLGLVLTETPFQLPQLSMNTDQIVFEEYGFGSYYRCIAPSLVPWTYAGDPDFSLVVDCGFSATWIVPIIYQSVYWKGVRKLPIGGRALNGLLREIISFRHYDISDEPVLINTIKESTCFMAQDFGAALKKKLAHECEFVLPDFKTTTTGYVRQSGQRGAGDLQSLVLTDERFVVPESLYRPEIIFDNAPSTSAILQTAPIKNLTDLVVEAIMTSPVVARPLLSQNITVVGGTSLVPGFSTRLEDELAKELPSDWKVQVVSSGDHKPDVASWYGGAELCQSEIIDKVTISKQEYYEHGSNWCQTQFGFRNV
ncbi:Actin- protein 6 [Yamadazyma tenuis]|uniref:Actin-like protein ARP6 n=1 Tax=Candida tenuis (strain ATCC 10573 / BCRC 21748 / CBS 615 / JCM 9827 / NBRC 10315 / NRRL Y-1498 / VKM Y-70) TaxID=590646 RepID=G3AW74_CANTC|nr:uncharacterized protein CANTEDRAFT_128878 [Yamadazyma tenuis ATCC 10573]EGV66472.1 hypothetical protein CANTEDRAFT_128878 [Yamadazyma tenuis ATCC 10573]WEJ95413.1 Actin- protein 6 [Yamadazyma tenuis]